MSTDTSRCRRFAAQVPTAMLAVLMLLGAGCSEKETSTSMDAATAQAPAQPAMEQEAMPATETPAPAAEAEAPQGAAESQSAAVDGQKVYQTTCQACHAAGIAGAPKLGDKEAWAPRIAKGEDALVMSVSNGFNAMPPKGGCMNCSEAELRAAVAYIVGQGS